MTDKMRVETKEMIETPDNWPQWPFLPIKKRDPKGGMSDCAILWDAQGYRTTIFKINMFDIHGKDDLLNSEQVKYSSVDEILDAGWIVD